MMRIVVLFMLILLSSPLQGEGREQWEEVELKRYGIGDQQSPINIQTADVQLNNDLGTLKMEYLPANATLNNLGHEIQVAWSGYAGNVVIEGVKYFLKQCHWHHPSEHTIDGTQYPLELHMVHQSDDDHIAVIGIIYNLGDANYFLTTLEDAIDEVEDEEEVNLGDVDPSNIGLGSNAAYYRYNGSLTTPPYTEGVIWTVIKQVSTVTEQQVDSLREALHGENNSRAVQPLNGRIVGLFEHIGIDMMYSSVISEAERAILSWSS